ncbi:MAG TPA: nucleotide exchange factor GrpE [Gemmataceae bacterium]|nr:nucleotide exchange factor GrpE [Gemmataceae bacterium]
MNDEPSPETSRAAAPPANDELTLGKSSIFKLFEAFIKLRETSSRKHKVFDQTLRQARDDLRAGFNSFAGDTQREYQKLRQEIHGEKKVSLVLLNELLEVGQDLEHIVAARPQVNLPGEAGEALTRWADAIEVECRKVQAALKRHGIHRYDAVIGELYNPAQHERVGSKRVDGLDGYRIAEQREHGWASQQPEFVLRRPKVIISE